MALKTGKAPATYDPKLVLLSDIRQAGIDVKMAPVGFGHQRMIHSWQMLGNDIAGDCVWAGADHETMLWNAEGGRLVKFLTKNALDDYAAATGYDPATGANDNGTDMRSALSIRRHVGVTDATGAKHKVGAYVGLEPGNWEQMLKALYAFSAVGIGFEFPVSAMDQFYAHKAWNVVPGAPIDGGHYVPVVARVTANYIYVVTWGRLIKMSRSFYMKYCDEAYAMISPEMLKKGVSPEGYDLAHLTTILSNL